MTGTYQILREGPPWLCVDRVLWIFRYLKGYERSQVKTSFNPLLLQGCNVKPEAAMSVDFLEQLEPHALPREG